MIDSVKCFGKIKEYTTGIASIINCFLNFVKVNTKSCGFCTKSCGFSIQMKALRQNFCIVLFICDENILLRRFKMPQIWNRHTDDTENLFSRFFVLGKCTCPPRTANDSITKHLISILRRRNEKIHCHSQL